MTERVLKFHSEIDTFDHELVLCEGPGPIYIYIYFLFVFSFIYLLVYLFIFINILICICICVYIHIHINVHIHIYIYIYIYIISYHISHTPCSHIAVFTRLLSLLGHPCLIWTSSPPWRMGRISSRSPWRIRPLRSGWYTSRTGTPSVATKGDTCILYIPCGNRQKK